MRIRAPNALNDLAATLADPTHAPPDSSSREREGGDDDREQFEESVQGGLKKLPDDLDQAGKELGDGLKQLPEDLDQVGREFDDGTKQRPEAQNGKYQRLHHATAALRGGPSIDLNVEPAQRLMFHPQPASLDFPTSEHRVGPH